MLMNKNRLLKTIGLLTLILILLSSGPEARGSLIIKPADQVTISGVSLDSSGFDLTPDSVRILVYRDGLEQHDAWYNQADSQCWSVNGRLVFSDLFGDIDSSGGPGIYEVMAGFYAKALYTWKTLWIQTGLPVAADLVSIEADSSAADSLKGLLDGAGATLTVSNNLNSNIAAIAGDAAAADSLRQSVIDGYRATLAGRVDSILITLGYSPTSIQTKLGDFSGAGIDNLKDALGQLASDLPAAFWGVDFDSAGAVAGSIGDSLSRAGYVRGSISELDSNDVYLAVLSALQADTAVVDTGSGSYAHATIGGAPGGSCEIPDSLLGIVSKIDSTLKSLGYDGLNNLHDKVDGLSLSGGGSEPETLIVLAAHDSTLIQAARVTIRTIDQSTTRVDGLMTDVNGQLILELDPDSFFVAINANNFEQIKDTILIAAGGGTDSLWLQLFSPGAPVGPELCRVYGWIYDIGGESPVGIEVTAEIPRQYHPVEYEDVIITPFSKSTFTDSTGYWQMDLLPNELLNPTGSNYLFTIKYQSGVIYRREAGVPDSTAWRLQ